MIGTPECPYAGRMEKWHEQTWQGTRSVVGYLFDNPGGAEPGTSHRTTKIEIINRVTGELKTKTHYYKLGKEG